MISVFKAKILKDRKFSISAVGGEQESDRCALRSREFLTYVGMTSEPGGPFSESDTFLTGVHLALITVIGSAQILLISNKPIVKAPM